MSYFDGTAWGPVMGLPAQPAHQLSFGRPMLLRHSQSLSHPVSYSTRPIIRSTSTFAGRKRSRDEAAANLDDPEKVVSAARAGKPGDKWEHCLGMVVTNTTNGYTADAGSKPGPWSEDNVVLDKVALEQKDLSQERLPPRGNKARRLGLPSDTDSSTQGSHVSGNKHGRETSSDAPINPVVDDFTMHLGVGWARLSGDEHIQAAARGWARYIDNHFPVTEARIMLQKSDEAYLVQAREGFFLFAENLREGRLISATAERAFVNLKSCPAIFDGPMMTAVECPRPQLQDSSNSTWNTIAMGNQHAVVSSMDVDMD